jgi:hypothetical protein
MSDIYKQFNISLAIYRIPYTNFRYLIIDCVYNNKYIGEYLFNIYKFKLDF